MNDVEMERALRTATAWAKDTVAKTWLEFEPDAYNPQPEIRYTNRSVWELTLYKDGRAFVSCGPMLSQAVADMVLQINNHFNNKKEAVLLLQASTEEG
jgi:hypothetical protein